MWRPGPLIYRPLALPTYTPVLPSGQLRCVLFRHVLFFARIAKLNGVFRQYRGIFHFGRRAEGRRYQIEQISNIVRALRIDAGVREDGLDGLLGGLLRMKTE